MIGSLLGSLDERRTVPLCLGPQRRVIKVNTPSPFTGFCGSSTKLRITNSKFYQVRIAYHHNHRIEVHPYNIQL